MVLSSDPYVWGTGRRKTSVARVRIKNGTGNFLVNGKPVEEFFTTQDTRRASLSPLVATESAKSYDIWVSVEGGGISGQAST